MTLTTWDEPAAPVEATGMVCVRLPSLDELACNWMEVEMLLAKATRITRCYEPIDLLRMAMAGQVGIWFCEHKGKLIASIVTEVKQFPRRRLLEIMFCGGTCMKLWIEPAIAVLDAHARHLGCDAVCGIGRPGWVRAWRGYAPGGIVIVRELGDG